MSLFKGKLSRLIKLVRLIHIQDRIKKLENYVDIPNFNKFYKGTSAENAAIFISDVLTEGESPRCCPWATFWQVSEDKVFWESFEKYSHEMKQYCINKDKANLELYSLEDKRDNLYQDLGIERRGIL